MGSHKPIFESLGMSSRDRLEVRTLRCGRNNPGSNPGHGTFLLFYFFSAKAAIMLDYLKMLIHIFLLREKLVFS